MDLKEAIESAEKFVGEVDLDAVDELIRCAKRELERQERERPKRASLSKLEECMRAHFAADITMDSIADILKALREKVVPWLRAVKLVHFQRRPFEPNTPTEMEKVSVTDLLRELGEEP